MNWVTLGANLTTMSDDVPLRLPRYVFRRSNGSFRYKRNVPERLRPLIGKATLYRQLGDSYREAMQALPLVHARIEALLNDEAVSHLTTGWGSDAITELQLEYLAKISSRI